MISALNSNAKLLQIDKLQHHRRIYRTVANTVNLGDLAEDTLKGAVFAFHADRGI